MFCSFAFSFTFGFEFQRQFFNYNNLFRHRRWSGGRGGGDEDETVKTTVEKFQSHLLVNWILRLQREDDGGRGIEFFSGSYSLLAHVKIDT